MAPHSSTLAWRIPWMEEPGRLQSMGSLRVRHDWATSLSLFTFMHWRRKWQSAPVFLPGVSQGRGSLVGCCLWGFTESDTTDVTYQQWAEKESHICGSLDHLHGAVLPGFWWPVILFAWFWVPVWYNSILPCVCASLSQDGFQHRGLWEGWHHLLWSGAPPFWTPKEAFCSQGVSLTSRIRNMWSLSFIWAGLSSSLPLTESWGYCPQGTDFSCSARGPHISCLRGTVSQGALIRCQGTDICPKVSSVFQDIEFCMCEAKQTKARERGKERVREREGRREEGRKED